MLDPVGDAYGGKVMCWLNVEYYREVRDSTYPSIK